MICDAPSYVALSIAVVEEMGGPMTLLHIAIVSRS